MGGEYAHLLLHEEFGQILHMAQELHLIRHAQLMREHLPKLRAPLGADALLETLEKELAALPALELSVPVEELEQHLLSQERRDPEQEIGLLLRGLELRPNDSGLVLLESGSLAALLLKA